MKKNPENLMSEAITMQLGRYFLVLQYAWLLFLVEPQMYFLIRGVDLKVNLLSNLPRGYLASGSCAQRLCRHSILVGLRDDKVGN